MQRFDLFKVISAAGSCLPSLGEGNRAKRGGGVYDNDNAAINDNLPLHIFPTRAIDCPEKEGMLCADGILFC